MIGSASEEDPPLPRRVARTALLALCVLAVATLARAGPPEAAAPAARGVVTGRVTGPDGAPVADLPVRLVVRSRRGPATSREARTGADGRYRCDPVPPGDVAAFVADRGFAARGIAEFLAADAGPLGRTLRAGATAEIDLVVERGARIGGRVLAADGTPLPATGVEAVVADDPGHAEPFLLPSVAASTGADGTFLLDGLIPGVAYDVRALPAGAPSFERPRVPAGVPDAAPLAIRLPRLRGIRLAVVVEGAPERPIAGAVAVVRVEQEGSSGRPGREVVTDAHGRARLLVPEGVPASVSVTAPGWSTAARQSLPAGDEIVVGLAPLGTITGRVLRPDGSPAVGADVSVMLAWGDFGSLRAVAGEDGRFTVEAVPAGTYPVIAGHRPPQGPPEIAVLPAAAGAQDVVLRLVPLSEPPRAALRVRALAPDGRPVPRAFVTLRTPAGWSVTAALSPGDTTLDLDGVSHDVKGAFVLVAWAEDERGAALPLGPAVVGPLAADQTTVEVRLPAERVLLGTVRGSRDEPVVGARVYVRGASRAGEDLRDRLYAGGRSGVWAYERTDAEGRFLAHGLPDEDLRVDLVPPAGYEAPALTAVPRGTSRVEVRVGASVRTDVTVLDPAGAPVVGVGVCALAAGDRCPSDAAVTDARGVAVVTGVRPGRKYLLRVEPSSDFLAWTRSDWDPEPTTVRLERAFGLSGVVRAPDGSPIARAFVKHDDAGTESWARSQETDEEGRFHFQRLKAGPHALSVALGDRLSADGAVPGPVTSRTVLVEAGAHDVEVVLEPGRAVEIVPPAGTPENAEIDVRCARGDHLLYGTRRAGRHERLIVTGLADDDRLTFFMPPDESGRSVVIVAGPNDSPVRLVRGVAGTIRGRVVLPEGAAGAGVRAVEERLEVTIDAQADATGRYEIRGVPEGWSWTINAWTTVNGVRHGGTVTHVGRGEAPDLVLRPER